jgi:hypothetical protein
VRRMGCTWRVCCSGFHRPQGRFLAVCNVVYAHVKLCRYMIVLVWEGRDFCPQRQFSLTFLARFQHTAGTSGRGSGSRAPWAACTPVAVALGAYYWRSWPPGSPLPRAKDVCQLCPHGTASGADQCTLQYLPRSCSEQQSSLIEGCQSGGWLSALVRLRAVCNCSHRSGRSGYYVLA